MLYFTLMPTRLVALGQPASEPEPDQLPAFTTPRSIAVGETVDLWGERSEIECVLDGRLALVAVSPRGAVHSGRLDETGPELVCDEGWLVEQHLSLDGLLGPEAARIRTIVATEAGLDHEADYDAAIEDHRAMDQLVEHATVALAAAGIDGDWWADQVSCAGGYELVALAATDLVDPASAAWNTQAFGQLLHPWVVVRGWPHVGPLGRPGREGAGA